MLINCRNLSDIFRLLPSLVKKRKIKNKENNLKNATVEGRIRVIFEAINEFTEIPNESDHLSFAYKLNDFLYTVACHETHFL